MPKMIQLRHVPDAVHRKLKMRAANKGTSLSEYLVREISQIAEQPTMEEFLERLNSREPVPLKGSIVAELRRRRGR